MKIVITEDMLEDLMTDRDGYTKATIEIIEAELKLKINVGPGYKLRKGWQKKLVGKRISQEKWDEAVNNKSTFIKLMATVGQVVLLRSLGYPEDQLAKMSKAEAHQFIEIEVKSAHPQQKYILGNLGVSDKIIRTLDKKSADIMIKQLMKTENNIEVSSAAEDPYNRELDRRIEEIYEEKLAARYDDM